MKYITEDEIIENLKRYEDGINERLKYYFENPKNVEGEYIIGLAHRKQVINYMVRNFVSEIITHRIKKNKKVKK